MYKHLISTLLTGGLLILTMSGCSANRRAGTANSTTSANQSQTGASTVINNPTTLIFPSAPQILSTKVLNDKSVVLNFLPVAGAIKYRITRTTGSIYNTYELFAWVDSTVKTTYDNLSWPSQNFIAETNYYFKIAAVDSQGKIGAETQPWGPIRISITSLPSPQNPSVKLGANNSVILNFSPVNGAIKYKVTLTSAWVNGTYELFSWVAGTQSTMNDNLIWASSMFVPGKDYYFKISAIDSQGMPGTETAPVGPVRIPIPLLPAPQNPSFKLLANQSVALNFSPVNGAIKYKVTRASGSVNGTYELLAWVEGTRNTTNDSLIWHSSVFGAGKDYYFKIAAIDSQGIPGIETAPVGPMRIPVTILPAPQNPSFKLLANNSVILNFFRVPGAFKYNIYRSAGSANGPFEYFGGIISNADTNSDNFSWPASSFTVGINYYFKIAAVDYQRTVGIQSVPVGPVTLPILNQAPKSQAVYRMTDVFSSPADMSTWKNSNYLYTQNIADGGELFRDPYEEFKTYTTQAGADCTAQLYKCGFYLPEGGARQFLSTDPACDGHLLNGSVSNPSAGFVCTQQTEGTVPLYQWYLPISQGSVYSPHAEDDILVRLGFVRSDDPIAYVPAK